MTIYFDMDGTIANLYGVNNWLDKLIKEDDSPYADATPLCDLEKTNVLLSALQNLGIKIGVVSWLSKQSTPTYSKKVRHAKRKWLEENFPLIEFDEMHFVKYGTRKDYVVADKKGFIFDDDERVRAKWKGVAINPMEEDINKNLLDILTALI